MQASKSENNPRSGPLTALGGILREIGFFVLGGFVGAIVLLWLFAKLSEEIFENEFTTLDVNFELWVHSFANTGLDAFFNFFTTIGSVTGMLILTALTFGLLSWRRHFHSAWLLVLVVVGGTLITQVLKALFRRPRPELWVGSGHRPTSFSFPSGHSTISLCFFGVLIWLGLKFLKTPLARVGWTILMLFSILMIGLSRIYFGVHYPTDVVGGFIAGSFWLITVISGISLYDRIHHIQSKNLKF